MVKIIAGVVVCLLIVNDISFALSPSITSSNIGKSLHPATQEDMYALGQKLCAAKRGPGAINFDFYKPGEFVGEAPAIDGADFIPADYNNPPKAWQNNPILRKTNLIDAVKYFRDSEANIPLDNLDIREGYFEVDEGKGELPIARIERHGKDKYVLVIHTKFVQMWNHIRANDVWCEMDVNGENRIVSLAWGIFYRLVKHEMTDLAKNRDIPIFKSLGHLGMIGGEFTVNADEKTANIIGGRYARANDAMWLWFLGSYAFGNPTRYNNDLFTNRARWFFDGDEAKHMNLHEEFPVQCNDLKQREDVIRLAAAINYHFFSSGIEVPELTVSQGLMIEHKNREDHLKGRPIYATGDNAEVPSRGVSDIVELAMAVEKRMYEYEHEAGETSNIIIQAMERSKGAKLDATDARNIVDAIRLSSGSTRELLAGVLFHTLDHNIEISLFDDELDFLARLSGSDYGFQFSSGRTFAAAAKNYPPAAGFMVGRIIDPGNQDPYLIAGYSGALSHILHYNETNKLSQEEISALADYITTDDSQAHLDLTSALVFALHKDEGLKLTSRQISKMIERADRQVSFSKSIPNDARPSPLDSLNDGIILSAVETIYLALKRSPGIRLSQSQIDVLFSALNALENTFANNSDGVLDAMAQGLRNSDAVLATEQVNDFITAVKAFSAQAEQRAFERYDGDSAILASKKSGWEEAIGLTWSRRPEMVEQALTFFLETDGEFNSILAGIIGAAAENNAVIARDVTSFIKSLPPAGVSSEAQLAIRRPLERGIVNFLKRSIDDHDFSIGPINERLAPYSAGLRRILAALDVPQLLVEEIISGSLDDVFMAAGGDLEKFIKGFYDKYNDMVIRGDIAISITEAFKKSARTLEESDIVRIMNALLELIGKVITPDGKTDIGRVLTFKVPKRILSALSALAARYPVFAGQITGRLLAILRRSVVYYKENIGKTIGRSSIEIIYEAFIDAFIELAKDSPYKTIPRIVKEYERSPDLRRTLLEVLKAQPAEAIARVLKINIKLANYLCKKGGFDRAILDSRFRGMMNDISYHLNREVTSHPAERRLGEDEKMSLFGYLFGLDDMTEAKRIFDAYFRNDPDLYRIEISGLVKLLEHVSLSQIRGIIRMVAEDPKQSLDEIKEAVRHSVEGQANADFIIREMEWILSNLFVLQNRLEGLGPLAGTLEESGRSSGDLIRILQEIDKASSLAGLAAIASSSGLNIVDLLKFKLESLSQRQREDLIFDGIKNLNNITSLKNSGREVFTELTVQFGYLPGASGRRVYFKLLLNHYTDNTAISRIVNDLQGRKGLRIKNSPFLQEFLTQYGEGFTDSDSSVSRFIAEADRLDNGGRKKALQQLRGLFGDRAPYSESELSEDRFAGAREILNMITGEIALWKPRPQIPHIFFEPLFRLGADDETLNIFRSLIAAMSENNAMHDQLATLKNRLYENVKRFAALGHEKKGEVFGSILTLLVRKRGRPSIENVEEIDEEFMRYLNQYAQAVDTSEKAEANGFSGENNAGLKELSGVVLSDLLERSLINDEKIYELSQRLAALIAEPLIARFRRHLYIENEAAVLNKLKVYASKNPRFLWRDHEGRNIFELIDIFLSTIYDEEVYRNIFDALMAEVSGRFSEWRYESEDYVATLDEVIRIEVKKLPEDVREKFDEKMNVVEGSTLYEKLQKIEGFEEIKARIARIRNWEKAFAVKVDDDLTGEFTDDFYALFNIGNYPNSTACQSCTHSTGLNRGLTGYVVNGTNKAVALLNKEGRVMTTRRIVRLRVIEYRVIEHEDPKARETVREPVIFIEESTQFGAKHIDRLYSLVREVSRATNLPVAIGPYKAAESEKIRSGERRSAKVVLFRGRSLFDYSDYYGHKVAGSTGDGHLYRHPAKAIVKGEDGVERDSTREIWSQPLDLIIKHAGIMVESVFDLQIAVLDSDAVKADVERAEASPSAHIVRISEPSPEQISGLDGYFHKPRKISYVLDLPSLSGGKTVDDAMAEYYNGNGFDSKHRWQYKKDVSAIDEAINGNKLELLFDDGVGDEAGDFKAFLKLYEDVIGKKARGRKPLLDAVARFLKEGGSYGGFLRSGSRIGIYLKDKRDGRVIGGVIVNRTAGHYSISYAAAGREYRSMQFYLMQTVMRKSIGEGFKTLSYGVDANLYGHHLSTGLMEMKVRAGFKPKPAAGAELMKITKFDVFDIPIFFYSFGENGALESNLIITEDKKDEIKKFEGITPRLNVYLLKEDALTPYRPIAPDHRELIEVISEYIARIEADKGPGAVRTLTEAEKQNIWNTVNLLHDSQIEILVSQRLNSTDTMKRAAKDINRRIGQEVISLKEYSSRDDLEKLLMRGSPSKVKRIIITEDGDSGEIRNIAESNAESFRGVRLLNLALPEGYHSMKVGERTIHQSRIIMIAALARMLEREGTPMVKAVLGDMIRDYLNLDEDGWNDFMIKLCSTDEETASIKEIGRRIGFFLDEIPPIRLTKELEQRMMFIKEFWTYA